MAEALCRICPISADRVLRRTAAGVVAVPEQTVRGGHIMVVSASHASSFSDLKPVEADALMALVAAAARAAEQASGADRYYVIRIGDKSPHLHFHLVPRADGETSLAPFVFGERGWSAAIRSDALPPAELFEQAFAQALRLDGLQNKPEEDPGRLPAWLVSLSLSLTAGAVAFAIAWPLGARELSPGIALGASSASRVAVSDRMAGRVINWGKTVLYGASAIVVYVFMTRWLLG